jgi:Tfp pilus assembly protein PilO
MTITVKAIDRFCLAAAIMALIVCGYWLFVQSLRQERLYHQEKNRLTKEVNDIAVAEKNIERLRASTRSTADELRTLSRQIPEDAQIGLFLKELDGLMQKREIDLISVQPQLTFKEKLYQRIPIKVSCRGLFVNIYHLLQDLDTLDRFVVVDRMTIGKAERAGYCRLDLTVLIFMRESQSSAIR